jgi:hypothetical protein
MEWTASTSKRFSVGRLDHAEVTPLVIERLPVEWVKTRCSSSGDPAARLGRAGIYS